MEVFYNKQGIGDCLIVTLKQGDRASLEHERFGDVVKISDKDNVVGYNIFNATKYLNLNESGKLTADEAMLDKLRSVFAENNLNDSLDVDLTPKFVIGYVENKKQHPNADKLNICKVDVGDEVLQIVCGAPNVDAGQKVVVAKVGAIMPSGMEIKASKLRGEDSFGMICSQKELGMPNAPQEKGIYVLNDQEEIGKPFTI